MVVNVGVKEFNDYLAKEYEAKVKEATENFKNSVVGLDAIVSFKEAILSRITEKGFKLNPDSLNRIMEEEIQGLRTESLGKLTKQKEAEMYLSIASEAFEGFKKYYEAKAEEQHTETFESLANPPTPEVEVAMTAMSTAEPAPGARVESPVKVVKKVTKKTPSLPKAPDAKKKPFSRWMFETRTNMVKSCRETANELGYGYGKYFSWEKGESLPCHEETVAGIIHNLAKMSGTTLKEGEFDDILQMWRVQRGR